MQPFANWTISYWNSHFQIRFKTFLLFVNVNLNGIDSFQFGWEASCKFGQYLSRFSHLQFYCRPLHTAAEYLRVIIHKNWVAIPKAIFLCIYFLTMSLYVPVFTFSDAFEFHAYLVWAAWRFIKHIKMSSYNYGSL